MLTNVRRLTTFLGDLWVGQPRCIILSYHRIADPPHDPNLLSVAPRHFEQHLEVLAEMYRPMSLSRLTNDLGEGTLREGALSITFDDGYADNLTSAQPLLEDYGFPATFFVTSGYVATGREFWWDELQRIMLESRTLPDPLELTIDGKRFSWQLDGGKPPPQGSDGALSGWNVGMATAPTPRHRAFLEIQALLRDLPLEQRERALEGLRRSSQVRAGEARHEYRPLRPRELRKLARSPWVQVGAHGVTHTRLASLSRGRQRAEIVGTKTWLEKEIGQKIRFFAYPYGGKGDYTRDTVDLVREAGFRGACASYPGWVQPSTDPYQLPRFVVYDWDGREFEKQLRAYYKLGSYILTKLRG